MEHHLKSDPPAALMQILRMFTSPCLSVGMGMPSGTASAAGPLAQLWFETRDAAVRVKRVRLCRAVLGALAAPTFGPRWCSHEWLPELV
jgi:hypothetical protein